MKMSPSDLPVNDIGTKSLHEKHKVVLEQSDSKFARAKVKDQLFVDYLLMEDILTIDQHINAEALLDLATKAGVYLKSPDFGRINTALGGKPSDIYSSALMRWARREKKISKKFGDLGIEIVRDHVMLDVWTRQEQRVALLKTILSQ